MKEGVDALMTECVSELVDAGAGRSRLRRGLCAVERATQVFMSQSKAHCQRLRFIKCLSLGSDRI